MKVWVELNLPPIPEELLLFEEEPPNRKVGDIGYGKKQIKDGRELVPCSYTNTTVTHQPLLDWLEKTLPIMGRVFLQYQSTGAHIVHTDLKRRWALNYIVETGGDNVVTAWYQQHGMPLVRGTKGPGMQTDTGNVDYSELTKVDQVVCQQHKWYLISTGVLHDVDSVETLRRSISIGYFDEDTIDKMRDLWLTND